MTAPTPHAAGLAAIVEVVTETLTALRLAFQVLAVDPQVGAGQISTHALLLSKSVAHLAKQMAHLPEEALPKQPPVAAIKLSDAQEIVAVMRAYANPRCKVCGGLT